MTSGHGISPPPHFVVSGRFDGSFLRLLMHKALQMGWAAIIESFTGANLPDTRPIPSCAPSLQQPCSKQRKHSDRPGSSQASGQGTELRGTDLTGHTEGLTLQTLNTPLQKITPTSSLD